MAAASASDFAGDAAGDARAIPLERIAAIIRDTCSIYNWTSSEDTLKTFIEQLTRIASAIGVSLEDLAASSEKHAREIDYSSISKFNLILDTNYYIKKKGSGFDIYVGEDNITNVIINYGFNQCYLLEITPDMIYMLRYLGVVRIYTKMNMNVCIPCWTDNIVYIKINNSTIMSHLDTHKIPFPKYLREMVDKTALASSFVDFLPNTLETLVSACIKLRNISPKLKNYTYTGDNTAGALAESEYLPTRQRNVIYAHRCTKLTDGEITMPPGTEHLTIGLKRITSPILVIRNIRSLYITTFNIYAYVTDKSELLTSNLTIEPNHVFPFNDLYRQNVNVILEEGLEHLIINQIRP
jgi:hypothetical protein